MKSNKVLAKFFVRVSFSMSLIMSFVFSSLSFATESSSPVEAFLKSNSNFKMKTNFSEDVKKLLGTKRNPALVKGDFNGDGITDYVVMLSSSKDSEKKIPKAKNNKDTDQMVFFYSVDQKFESKAKDVPSIDNIYLSMVSKSMVKTGLPNNKPRDLAQLEIYYGPTTAYFVEGSEVVEFKGTLAPMDK